MGPRPGRTRNCRLTASDAAKEGKINNACSDTGEPLCVTPEFCNRLQDGRKARLRRTSETPRHRFWQPMPGLPMLTARMIGWSKRCMRYGRISRNGGLPGSNRRMSGHRSRLH